MERTLKINNPVTVSFDVTWFKGTEKEVTRTLERSFDLADLSGEDILEYAMRTLVIAEQARVRSKDPKGTNEDGTSLVPERASIKVAKPGVRTANVEKVSVVDSLIAKGLSKDQATNFAKLMAKDESAPQFFGRLSEMLKALGMNINLN